jgi:hypothetical protein
VNWLAVALAAALFGFGQDAYRQWKRSRRVIPMELNRRGQYEDKQVRIERWMLTGTIAFLAFCVLVSLLILTPTG